MLTHTSTAARPALDIAVSARRVTRQYGEGESAVHALRGVSLEVPVGQFTAVMGPSGSGKSTLMHLLAGLDRPTNGRVKIGGEDITEMPDKQLTKLRRRHIGFVFQQFNLLPMLTAEENILLPLSIAGRKPDKAAVASLIARVGLGERLGHKPSQLSGGQQQRVAIARAIAKRPTLLLCDEPTGALDFATGRVVLEVIERMNRELGAATAVITHNAAIADMGDRVIGFRDGRIAETRVNASRKSASELSW